MQFLKQLSTRYGNLMRFTALLVMALSFSTAALAQGPPPRDLDFNDSPAGAIQYNSTGRAVYGVVTANVRGKIRGGRVYTCYVDIGQFNGPNRLERLTISYTQNPSIIPPSVRWYNVNATTQRLEILGVPARQDFAGTAFSSKGLANVQVTFVNGQPGKAVVIYSHKTYQSPYTSSTTPPVGVRAYSGTVMSAAPLNGRRLYYEWR